MNNQTYISFCIMGIMVIALFICNDIQNDKIDKIDKKLYNELYRINEKFYDKLKEEPNQRDIIPAKKNENKENFSIDIKKIIQIESSGNPNAHNKRTNARGLCQIRRLTWYECCSRLKHDWSFEEAFDPVKNVIIGEYYMNKRIPQMLKAFNIPDNTDNRLIAYNWGIGNLDKARKSYGKIKLPRETQRYIEKYNDN
jgi:soluble lytic murein transglycosylase-like protein